MSAVEPTSRREQLAVLSHELRSPVAALVALAFARDSLPAEARGEAVRLAVAAARDIDRLLSDPDLVSLRPQLVDVGAVASGFSAASVSVNVHGRPTANADPTRLRQAVANLVANGLRHGTSVTIDVAERDGLVVLDVSDDGPGVERGADPFARGASGAGSTGLGLWLARAIADAHGGSLDVLPGTAAGARFRLALPSASGVH